MRFHQNVLKPALLTGYVKFKRGEPLNVNKVLELQSALSDSPYWGRVEVVTRQDEAKDLEVPIDVNLDAEQARAPHRRPGLRHRHRPAGAGHRGVAAAQRAAATAPRSTPSSRGSRRGFKTSYLIPGAYPRTDLLSLNLAFDRLDTKTSPQRLRPRGGDAHRVARRLARGATRSTSSAQTFTVGLDHGTSNLVVPGVSLERVNADDRIDTTNGYRVRALLPGRREVRALRHLVPPGLDRRQGHPQLRRPQPPHHPHPGGLHGHQRLPRAAAAVPVLRRRRPERARLLVPVAGPQGRGRQHHRRRDAGAWRAWSIEHRFFTKWGAAVFYDTGNASQSFSGLGTLARGAGVGLRWRSPIGPIRVDVAVALSEPGHPIRFHLNIGPDL